MKVKRFEDERITSEVQKYGHHAFGIVLALLMVSCVIKLFVFDWDMKYWLDTFMILMLASGYMTFRMMKAGLLLLPSKQVERKRLKKINIISGAIAALLWGALMFIFDMTDKSETFEVAKSILSNAVGAVVFFIGITCIQWVMMKISTKNANKDLD